MKWRTANEDDFHEDWMFSHYRYKHSNDKLDTDLFEIKDGALQKIGGTGRLSFYSVEILDESAPHPSAVQAEALPTKQQIDEAVEKYAFRVPYDGTNNFYDEVALKHFKAGIEWYHASLSAPQDEGTLMDEQIGESIMADFEESTWTFRMNQDFTMTAGKYKIIPLTANT